MEIEVRMPEKITAFIKEPYSDFINETVVIELYREGVMTLRQAAELLDISLPEIFEVLSKRNTYINYGNEELEEDITYARS